MTYKELKEEVTGNMIATMQVDFSDGQVPFNRQVSEEKAFNRGIIRGCFISGSITEHEYEKLTSYVKSFNMQCEW